MLYSKDKKVLKIIRKTNPKLPNNYYDWNDIWEFVQIKYQQKISDIEYISALNNLHNQGFITFADKHKTAFSLNSCGRYYTEYIRNKIINYILDKWIDFFALIIAIAALIISIISLLK